jgi:hypothetical protein
VFNPARKTAPGDCRAGSFSEVRFSAEAMRARVRFDGGAKLSNNSASLDDAGYCRLATIKL